MVSHIITKKELSFLIASASKIVGNKEDSYLLPLLVSRHHLAATDGHACAVRTDRGSEHVREIPDTFHCLPLACAEIALKSAGRKSVISVQAPYDSGEGVATICVDGVQMSGKFSVTERVRVNSSGMVVGAKLGTIYSAAVQSAERPENKRASDIRVNIQLLARMLKLADGRNPSVVDMYLGVGAMDPIIFMLSCSDYIGTSGGYWEILIMPSR